MNLNAVILAAGKGTRMHTDQPKCAHQIIDKPMVEYVIDELESLNVNDIVLVVGYKKEILMNLIGDRVKYAVQENQLGTAHAVLAAEDQLRGKQGITIIAIGDMPFISKQVYYSLITSHMQEKADLTVLTVDHPSPFGYGRIVRDSMNNVLEIVEDKDCTKEQYAIHEINSSIYAVNTELLFDGLKKIENNNKQHEYYLTDIVKVFVKEGKKVCGFKTSANFEEISGINDKLQLMEAEERYQRKIIENLLTNGVTIKQPASVVISPDAIIEPGAIILPSTQILGNTIVRSGATIGPESEIQDCIIGKNAVIYRSAINGIEVNEDKIIGPYEFDSKDGLEKTFSYRKY